ncbi:syntaxin-16 [Bacillus rossius redtenbacheri]|uniref:syntaxin-16 n=1 Tax=Bacillus rossius redtenbacheri TaxID=93214 RepID=UPI002FDEF34C
MTTRSLTDVFVLMRNNAMQSRHIYSEQRVTDRMSLVGPDAEGGLELRSGRESRLPPAWADGLEEAQYCLSRLRSKVQDLEALHARHLLRPTLDDSSGEERQIEALAQEVARMFGTAHKVIQQIRRQSSDGSQQEKKLSYNVVSSLVASLQDLSVQFRSSQSSYLAKLDSREERSRQYLSAELEEAGGGQDDLDLVFGMAPASRGVAQQQLLLLEEQNTRAVARREEEVRQIVRSIADLNHVFKDLAHLVADQGTILDRIDYNIEQTQSQVHQGYQQLQKADKLQRKNRKMVCILILATSTILLTILLIIVKT